MGQPRTLLLLLLLRLLGRGAAQRPSGCSGSTAGTCSWSSCDSYRRATCSSSDTCDCPADLCSWDNAKCCDNGQVLVDASCVWCAAGQYQNGNGCTNCAAGQSGGGQRAACAACAAGQFAGAGQASCTACAGTHRNSPASSTSQAACVCPAGRYGPSGGSGGCTTCTGAHRCHLPLRVSCRSWGSRAVLQVDITVRGGLLRVLVAAPVNTLAAGPASVIQRNGLAMRHQRHWSRSMWSAVRSSSAARQLRPATQASCMAARASSRGQAAPSMRSCSKVPTGCN